MKSYTIEGIILKRKNIGEADKLLTILSKDRGKLTVRAIGIRRLKSRRAGSLDLFNHISAQIVDGKTDIGTLTEVSLIQSFSNWKKHLGRINLAYQLTEIIDKLIPDQSPVPEIYNFLLKDFNNLSTLGNEWQTDFKSWLVEIIVSLGYWSDTKNFSTDVYDYISSLTDYPLSAPQMLKKLSHSSR